MSKETNDHTHWCPDKKQLSTFITMYLSPQESQLNKTLLVIQKIGWWGRMLDCSVYTLDKGQKDHVTYKHKIFSEQFYVS